MIIFILIQIYKNTTPVTTIVTDFFKTSIQLYITVLKNNSE